MGTFDYNIWLFKNRINKYKYLIILLIILIVSITYFIFFREIRNFNVLGSKINIQDNIVNSDIKLDMYIRSKKNISNVSFNYKLDLKINNNFKEKVWFENFLSWYTITQSVACWWKKECLFFIKDGELFKNVVDSIYSYNKNTLLNSDKNKLPTLPNSNLQPQISSVVESGAITNSAIVWNNTDNFIPNVQNQDLLSFVNWDTWNIWNDLNIEKKESNYLLDNWIGIEEQIDCKDKNNIYNEKCFKTPKIDMKIIGIKVNYAIVYSNSKNKTEYWYIYHNINNGIMKITWNK